MDSRGGPVTWPPRSPDHIPHSFFFWGCIKDAVHVPPLADTLSELTGRIREAVATVTFDTLNNVWAESDCIYDNCRAAHSAFIEHLWNVGHKNLNV
jgi:hypothetical protein